MIALCFLILIAWKVDEWLNRVICSSYPFSFILQAWECEQGELLEASSFRVVYPLVRHKHYSAMISCFLGMFSCRWQLKLATEEKMLNVDTIIFTGISFKLDSWFSSILFIIWILFHCEIVIDIVQLLFCPWKSSYCTQECRVFHKISFLTAFM